MEDLKSLVEDFNKSTADFAPEAARSNWKTLVSHLDKIGKQLVERIKEQTDEVESLRDEVCPEKRRVSKVLALTDVLQLFNATAAVREPSATIQVLHQCRCQG